MNMKPIDCGVVREAIPELVHGMLADEARVQVEAHVERCAECDAELVLVRALSESRPGVADDLAIRIRRAVAFDRQAVHRPWWALAAAAVAALALGIGVTSGDGVGVVAPAFAMEVEESWPWVLGEGTVAGSVVLEDLSDDALEALLADLVDEDGGS
ncbi:MAG: zf-HC2 domain-containing protein [Gemmatimonadota bacterium]